MSESYVVRWWDNGRHVHERVEADSPEEAAEQAVDEYFHPEWADGCEVSVFEQVLSRHDVMLGGDDE